METLSKFFFLLCSLRLTQAKWVSGEKISFEFYKTGQSKDTVFQRSIGTFIGVANSESPKLVEINDMAAIKALKQNKDNNERDLQYIASNYTAIAHRRDVVKYTYDAKIHEVKDKSLIFVLCNNSDDFRKSSRCTIDIYTTEKGLTEPQLSFEGLKFKTLEKFSPLGKSDEYVVYYGDLAPLTPQEIQSAAKVVTITRRYTVFAVPKRGNTYSIQYVGNGCDVRKNGKQFHVFQIQNEIPNVKEYLSTFIHYNAIRMYTLKKNDAQPVNKFENVYIMETLIENKIVPCLHARSTESRPEWNHYKDEAIKVLPAVAEFVELFSGNPDNKTLRQVKFLEKRELTPQNENVEESIYIFQIGEEIIHDELDYVKTYRQVSSNSVK